MADCRALLIAVANGDGEAAAIALDAMRRAAHLDTVERAVRAAADVLKNTGTGTKVGTGTFPRSMRAAAPRD